MTQSHHAEDPHAPLELSVREAHVLLIGNSPSARDLQCRIALAGYAHLTRVPDLAAAERAVVHSAPHLLIADPAVGFDRSPKDFVEDLLHLLPVGAAPAIVCLARDAEQGRDYLDAGAHDVWTYPIGGWVENRLRLCARVGILQRQTLSQHRDFNARIQARTTRLERALTVLKQAEMRLMAELENSRAASRHKSEFIAHISHELRNPLNAISGFSEIMTEEMFGPLGHERYHAQARTIYTASQHLLGIVNNLLDLAKAESGKTELADERVQIRTVVQETIELFSKQASDAGVTLKSDVAPDVPELQSDPGKIRQILINLVSNAIKFTASGGQVTISAKRDKVSGVLLLVISDTGVGVAPEDLERIMQPYVQVPHPSKAAGTGLGLPITKQFVEMLGGTLEVQSEVGKGTTFTVRLPLQRPHGSEQGVETAEPPAEHHDPAPQRTQTRLNGLSHPMARPIEAPHSASGKNR